MSEKIQFKIRNFKVKAYKTGNLVTLDFIHENRFASQFKDEVKQILTDVGKWETLVNGLKELLNELRIEWR